MIDDLNGLDSEGVMVKILKSLEILIASYKSAKQNSLIYTPKKYSLVKFIN